MDPQTVAAVEAAVQSGELHRIAAILDAAELEAPHPLPAAWPTALHVLAHALNGDLADARHAHHRLAPDTAAAGPGPLSDQAAALRALRRMWPGDGGPATAAASEAGPEAEAATVFALLEGHAWPAGPTAAVAAALARALRARALGEVGAAYARLPLREAALLLGHGSDEAAAAAAARAAGWRVIGGGEGAAAGAGGAGEAGGGAGGGAAAVGVAFVEPRAAAPGGGAAEPQIDAAGALRRLTEYLAHLEGDGFGGLLAGAADGGPQQQRQQQGAAAAAGGG